MSNMMQMVPAGPNNPGLLVRFYPATRENTYKTKEEGRPIHDPIVMIEKLNPGSSDGGHKREKWPEDETEYPTAWAAFLAQAEIPPSGTRLEDWGQLAIEQIADLKGIHVSTVEELSALTDGQLDNLGLGGRDLRTRALAYLEGAKDKNYASRLAGQMEELKRELEEVRRIAKEQAAELKELKEEKPKRK